MGWDHILPRHHTVQVSLEQNQDINPLRGDENCAIGAICFDLDVNLLSLEQNQDINP